jgi:biopolymer transport protein ExbB/TolQ
VNATRSKAAAVRLPAIALLAALAIHLVAASTGFAGEAVEVEIMRKTICTPERAYSLSEILLFMTSVAGLIRLCLCIGLRTGRPRADLDAVAAALQSLRLGQAAGFRKEIERLASWFDRVYPDDAPIPFDSAVRDIERRVALDEARAAKWTRKLHQLGLLALLVGCLGTITGLISAFQVVEVLRAPTPGDVAAGVYESLSSAAFALSIWIVLSAAGTALGNSFALHYRLLRGVLSRFRAPGTAAAIVPARDYRLPADLPAPAGMAFAGLVLLLACTIIFGVLLGQRDIEEVRLPAAWSVREDRAFNTDSLTVNVHHRAANEIRCDLYARRGACREASHWRIAIRGLDCTDESRLARAIREEADLRRPDPRNPVVSESRVQIRADAQAPWQLVQQVYAACTAAGIYQVEAGAGRMPVVRNP